MKKSMLTLELIITILILSIIVIYSLRFITNLYKINSQNLIIINQTLDFQTTNLFIENKLHSSVNIKFNQNKITFYEENTNDFKSGLYSGFILLENSTKEFIFTPHNFLSNLQAKYIWFNDNNIYEIEKIYEKDKIYFKNKTTKKKIYEQYKLLTKKSEIYLKKEKLFFNDSILLNNINTFKVKKSQNNILINICANACQDWVISL